MKRPEKMHPRAKLVTDVEFDIRSGQSLVVSLRLLGYVGLHTVAVENKKGIVHVRAHGHPGGGRFEFYERKWRGKSGCDFWLANPVTEIAIQDVISSKFWGQFNWGDLLTYGRDPEINAAIDGKIRELVEQFEEEAARTLNQLMRKLKREYRNRKKTSRARGKTFATILIPSGIGKTPMPFSIKIIYGHLIYYIYVKDCRSHNRPLRRRRIYQTGRCLPKRGA